MTKRREFIKKTAMGTAGIAIGGMGFNAKSYNSIIGSNDRIHMALIGIRNHGRDHIENWCKLKDSHNVVLSVLCDTDESLFESRSKMVFDKSGVKPDTEWDLRKVIDYRNIDTVAIATPNHWHALATIWSCQAGKHVYVEKPASHNIWEGRKMIEVARKTNLLVQVGLNRRSSNIFRDAIKFLHNDGIGELYMARSLCFGLRNSYGIAKDSTPPPDFHYDQWLGPAPYRPYNEKRSHYNWHWYWDTGNGDTGNTGPHMVDIARWGLNKNEHPVSIYSTGGLYGFSQNKCSPDNCTPGVMVYGDVKTYGHDKTSQETPNIQSCLFKYRDGKIIELETRNRYTNQEGSQGQRVGNIFYGNEGWLEISDDAWRAFHRQDEKPFAGSHLGTAKQPDNLYANFIDAIRSGKNEILDCDINDGFYSSSLPLLANISYRVGRELKFNGDTEKFDNDPEADTHLTRVYRKPYVVPDKV